MTAHTSVGKQKPPRSRPQNSCAGFADGLKIMAPGIRRAERGGRVFFGGRQAVVAQYTAYTVRAKRQPYVRTHQPGEGERRQVSGSVETAWRSGIEASAKVVDERRCQVSSAHTALGFQSGMPLKFPAALIAVRIWKMYGMYFAISQVLQLLQPQTGLI